MPDGCLLVGVENGERVDKRKVAGDCVELGVRNEPVLVVVVVLEHRLHTSVLVLLVLSLYFITRPHRT